MMRLLSFPVLLLTLLMSLLSACNSVFVPRQAQYSNQRITRELATDSVLYNIIKPYGDSVDKSMGTIIGTVREPLEKDQP